MKAPSFLKIIPTVAVLLTQDVSADSVPKFAPDFPKQYARQIQQIVADYQEFYGECPAPTFHKTKETLLNIPTALGHTHNHNITLQEDILNNPLLKDFVVHEMAHNCVLNTKVLPPELSFKMDQKHTSSTVWGFSILSDKNHLYGLTGAKFIDEGFSELLSYHFFDKKVKKRSYMPADAEIQSDYNSHYYLAKALAETCGISAETINKLHRNSDLPKLLKLIYGTASREAIVDLMVKFNNFYDYSKQEKLNRAGMQKISADMMLGLKQYRTKLSLPNYN